MGILASIFLYTSSVAYNASATEQIFHMVILISFFKVMNRLEEIVRDMSMSVGLGSAMGGGFMQKAGSMVYTTQSFVNLVRGGGRR